MLHLRVVITSKDMTIFDSVGSEDSWLKGVFIWSAEVSQPFSFSFSFSLPFELNWILSWCFAFNEWMLACVENEWLCYTWITIRVQSARSGTHFGSSCFREWSRQYQKSCCRVIECYGESYWCVSLLLSFVLLKLVVPKRLLSDKKGRVEQIGIIWGWCYNIRESCQSFKRGLNWFKKH